jgi:ADP-heptose:LPS heptosyltransferase
MKRILFLTGEGIGNVIQTIPTIRTITDVLGYKVDFVHLFGSFKIPEELIPYVSNFYAGESISSIDTSKYDGKVATIWAQNHVNHPLFANLPLLNKIKPLRMDRSEVDIYMDIARDLGAAEEEIFWHGNCNYRQLIEYYPVVIHNGYNPHGSAGWEIKSYEQYAEVAALLKSTGLDVCSVGAPHEYIDGTFNLTGIELMTVLGVMHNCDIFIGNDSGLYHCANALEKNNLVVFTATSIEKNYDVRFHKYSKLLFRDDLECRPCQDKRGWKDCKTWECKELNPEKVFIEAVKVMGAK